MKKYMIEIVLPMESRKIIETIQIVLDTLIPDQKIKFGGRVIHRNLILDKAKKHPKYHFRLENKELEFIYNKIANHNFDLIIIYTNELREVDLWSKLINEINKHIPVIQAFIYNANYFYNENLTSIEDYHLRGLSEEDLRVKFTGAPKPLDQYEVDTSFSPGRRIMKQGYIESVSSFMWFGESFFKLLKLNKISVLDSLEHFDFAQVIDNSLLFIKSDEHPFSDRETEYKQNALRSSIYSNAKTQ